jgi:Sulfite exporter TauE/SafE
MSKHLSLAGKAIVISGMMLAAAVLVEVQHARPELFTMSHLSRQFNRVLETVAAHKDLFPLDQSDYLGTALVGIGLMIAASGGVGGGGILVPLLIIVYGFHPKNAIALSNFTILGSSVTNMVLNVYKRHPEADRPLVDWDLILVMEPLTMAGAVS